MKLTSVLFVLDIFITVEGWPCVSPVRNVYSRINTDAALQYTADLTNRMAPRQFEVRFHDGAIQARIRYNADRTYTTEVVSGVSITGDTAGNVAVTLQNVQLSNAGIYLFAATGLQYRCNCLYILGTPTKPTISINKVPAVGESATLTCSSTSTTTPSNHSLSIRYNWRVDNVDNPSGSRYVYSTNRNTLTLSNIVKDDTSKQFTCTATEDVTDGYTSSRSDSFSFDVHYGPENLDFSPSDTSYEIEENTNVDPVTCGASCNPSCSFKWTKIGQAEIVSNTAVLSLGTLTGSEAGTYRCTVTRSGGFSQTKDLIVNVIYGPRNMLFNPDDTSYRRDENVDLPPITCSADCWDCSYRWTGPNSFSSSGQVLDLDGLQRSMAGQYICTATNTKLTPQTQQSKDLQLEVRYGPESVTLTPGNVNYTTDEGSTLTDIKCVADCFPTCTYKWTKEGQTGAMSNTDTLPLGQIQKSYAGKYTCRATNGDTASRWFDTHVTISVRYGPYQSSTQLSPTTQEYIRNEGTNLPDISCSADCYPDCIYTWTKTRQGKTTTVSSMGVLSLGTVDRDGAAVYNCKATNPGKSASPTTRKQVTVKVRYGPNQSSTILSPTTQEYTRNEGTNLPAISCSADCYPDCSYTWTKTQQGKTTTVSSTGILSLGSLDRDDAAVYNCTARNPGKSASLTTTKQVTVRVRYGPYQSSTILSPTTQEYTRNEGTNLPAISCSADCYPDCTYTWTKTRQGKTTTVSSTGILSLGTLDRDDAAVYTCRARNPGKTTSPTTTKQVTVKVRYGPNTANVNVQSPYNLTEGDENVEINCSSDCYPGCSYTWTNLTSGSKSSTNGTFSLEMVNTYMTGDLKCTSTNTAVQLPKSSEITVTVNVKERTAVKSFYIGSIDGQTSVTVDEYDVEVRFTCIVGGDSAESVKIMFNGETLLTQANTNILIFFRHNIDCFHAGIYTCEVRNRYGQTSTKIAALFVRCSPRPLRQIRENITSPLYEPVLLRFVTLAYPAPGPKRFSWYKEKGVRWIPVLSNEDFKISSSGLQSNLTILNVSQSDYGQYRVTVENDIGTYNQYLLLLGTDLQGTRSESREMGQDKTTMILIITSAILGILCVVLAIYSTYLTILKKRNTKTKDMTENSPKAQTTYVNMAYKSDDTNTQGAAEIFHGTDDATDAEENTLKEYTDLAELTRDDKIYDVIKKV